MSSVKSILFRLSLLVLLLFGMLFLVARQVYLSALEKPIALAEQSAVFEVNAGESFNSVIYRLSENNVIEYAWAAKLFIKQNQLGNQLKIGEFRLDTTMSLEALLRHLTTNNTIQYQVQFIEGQSYKEALRTLSEQSNIIHKLKGKKDQEILSAIGLKIDANHLEGLIYPDTYNYRKGESDLSILKRAHARLVEILNSEWEARDKKSPLKSPYEALILASIVEKETGAAYERAEISGVFSRRLIKKMRLQTDPTVIYGLGERYQGNIKKKHLREDTPYNTYRIKGLPPTPIALVGRAAIHAALNPKAGTSLYFVAKGDGTHQFSETIDEHNKAVRKYQLKRRSDYRSSIK